MTDTIKISRELLERAATLLQDSLHPPAGCDSFDDWTAQGNALAAELRALLAAQPQASYKVPCKTHPDAPHGFCRNSSHTAGRYVCVCECEHWKSRKPAPRNLRQQGSARHLSVSCCRCWIFQRAICAASLITCLLLGTAAPSGSARSLRPSVRWSARCRAAGR